MKELQEELKTAKDAELKELERIAGLSSADAKRHLMERMEELTRREMAQMVRAVEEEAQAELARILDVQASPAAYASYQDFVAGSQLESQVSLEEYSVSNRGLRAGLVGTPEQVTARIREYEAAGVDLMLLQFSPQREEMARFGRDVIAPYAGSSVSSGNLAWYLSRKASRSGSSESSMTVSVIALTPSRREDLSNRSRPGEST